MNTNADVIRVELALESSAAATLKPKMRAYAKDSRRIVTMEGDGTTLRYYWDSTRLADQSGTYGTAVIGTAGITGITPNAGSSGAASTLADMLIGIRDSTVLKSPYNSTINTVQPIADYVPFAIKGFSGGVANLFTLGPASGNTAWFDNAGNLTLSQSVAADVSVRVINTNNASGSANAKLLLSVGGASAGDPFTNYSVNGGQQWSEGIDRSDAFKYKISESATLGTNDALIIASGGAITLNRAVSAGFTLGVTGAVSFASYLEFTTSGSGGAGRIWKSSTTGLTIEGVAGSSYDLTLLNPSAQALLRNPTGTQNLEVVSNLNILGTLSVTGTSSLTGNLTLSRAAAGSTVLATISNTDNTNSNSNAELLISTGGASGGAPYIRLTDGVNDWTAAVNSGNFEIGNASIPSGNVVLSINHTTRVVSFPLAGVTMASTLGVTGAVSLSSTLGVSGVATFTAAPVFSSVTASQILSVDASKNLTSIATTGSGSIALATSPALTSPTVATSLTASYATANTAAAFDASKNLVSVTNTGTGNNVLSASPTLTGTIAAAAMTLSSTLGVTGVQTNSEAIVFAANGTSGAGRIWRSAVDGLNIAGVSGSSYDLLIWNAAGSNQIIGNPHGTNDIELLALGAGAKATINGNLLCEGGAGSYFRFPRGTSHPSSPPGQGVCYENTADGHLYRYNGSAWAAII